MTAHIKKGFTLIELLIVMAILGVLAVVVLVAINPAEQMRRARDTGRISGVQQIGRAAAAYYTANGVLPGGTGTWDADLTDSQELQTIPAGITPTGYTAGCASPVHGTWCYADDGTEYFAVWSELESQQRTQQCGGSTPYAVYSSYDARGGVASAAPTAGANAAWCE
jgi:prepilin-type N-terminal cleavage/methylation domain-containing protein